MRRGWLNQFLRLGRSPLAFDREISAITTFCEASSLSFYARCAVAQVQMNRFRQAPRFGSTIAEVCLRRMQFSEWNDDKGNNGNLLRAARANENDLILRECVEAFDRALAGFPDATDGATHFYDSKGLAEPPKWAEGATKTAQIDSLVFFRDVK